jgi:hypothetical protein
MMYFGSHYINDKLFIIQEWGFYMKDNVHETISATDLVRHFSAMIDKVRMSGRSLYITKGVQTIAKLSPKI